MGRPLRVDEGGRVYHVLNRANARAPLFEKAADYAAFLRVLAAAVVRAETRLLAYCVLPNHWHLVVWPRQDGELARFVGWLTLTHTQRWHAHYHTAGTGHLYQGRYKSFPVQEDEHLLTLCRYVERNPLRAGLVQRAEAWQWSSLWEGEPEEGSVRPELSAWPVARPRGWREWVNAPLTAAEEEALRQCIQRGQPFGEPAWQAVTAQRLGLEATFQPRGRPRKPEKGS